MAKVVAVSVLVLLAMGTAMAGDGGKVPWKKDVPGALAEAKQSGKPMMLYFTSEG